MRKTDALEQELSEAEAELEGFRQFLEKAKLKPSTISGYVEDARRFERWRQQQNVSRRRKKKLVPDLESVGSYMKDRSWSASYQNRLRYSLGYWSRYLEERTGEQVPPLFVVSNLERRAIESGGEVASALSVDEVYQLALAARRYSRSTERIRNFSLVLFVYGTGLTGREVCSLTMEDIVTEGEMALRLTTRGSECLLPLSAIAQDSLNYWLAERQSLSSVLRSKAPVWFTLSANGRKKPGDPLQPQGLRTILGHYGERAGIPEKVTPQRIRRTFQLELRGAGVKKPIIQALVASKISGEGISFLELAEAVSHLPSLNAVSSDQRVSR